MPKLHSNSRDRSASLYCTWQHRTLLPQSLRSKFRDLDELIRDLVASATSRLIIVSPYLSPAGMSALKSGIAISATKGAWIRIVTTGLERPEGLNRQAINVLMQGIEGDAIKKRTRLLTGSEQETLSFLHAKVIVADGARGYLGSANLSRGGLENNFEVGTALTNQQAQALDELVAFFEAENFLVDQTASIIAPV